MPFSQKGLTSHAWDSRKWRFACFRRPPMVDVIRLKYATPTRRVRADTEARNRRLVCMFNRIRERLNFAAGAIGTVAAFGVLVIAPFAAIAGGSDLLALILAGHPPRTPLGVWSLIAATAATVGFFVWNCGEAAKLRPRDLLRPLTASVLGWSVPFILAVLNVLNWWSEGLERVVSQALLVWAVSAVLISLPIASWQQLEHATKYPIYIRTSYYTLEGQARSEQWRVIAEIDDDVLELARAQDKAFEDDQWSALCLTIERRSCQVVRRYRRNNYWDHVNILASGAPDDGLAKAA
jgi:uncharacterized membrane protein